MRQSIRIRPLNSILFIEDVEGGQVPEITRNERLWFTPSCICIGCLMEQDGETEVTLGASNEIDIGAPPVFDGFLETPGREVVVSTVEGKKLLCMPVSEIRTRVRIWANRAIEPDRVLVGLG